MKKIFLILIAVMLFFSSASLAEDLSALTDREVLALYQGVQAEMERRGLSAKQGTEFEAADVRDRVTAFFSFWSSNDLNNMLEICNSGWKSACENPLTELFTILRNRTPLDLEIRSASPIAGESVDGLQYYLVTVTTLMDRNDGRDPVRYLFRFLMRKEEDGLWYLDPTSFNNSEDAEEAFTAEATEGENDAGMAETVLYYQPDGGEYYHLDQNCRRVNPALLPLQGSFLYSELNSEPYRNLKRCEICGAPLAPETDPFHFETFGDVLNASSREFLLCSEYRTALIEQDGRYFRAVAYLDEHAKELHAAYVDTFDPENDTFPTAEWQELDEYTQSLPVQYTEELFVVPLSQAELDAMAGHTLEEVMSEPWELKMRGYPEDAEAGKDVVFPMVKGFCNYELVISEPYEVYAERRAADRYEPVTIMSLRNYLDLTVKCVRYAGHSSNLLDLRYQPDGTFHPDSEPFPDDYDYDLMVEIADRLAEVWTNGEPDEETKEAMISEMTEEHPEAADMIRQIVESFH